MAYRKVLSTTPGSSIDNTRRAITFLVEQLGARHHEQPENKNMVILEGKSWWVIPATSNHGVDLCNGQTQNPIELLNKIKKLQAGVLIFRQMAENRLCIYLITDLDNLAQRLESYLVPMWDTIEIVKTTSDIGILIGNELIGFRKLRNHQPSPI